MRGPLDVRFWSKVEVNGPDECWPWLAGGKTTSYGARYGEFWKDGRMHSAHCIAYELAIGPIPTGMELDHLCRRTICVNPAHLQPVPKRVNILRGIGAPAQNARKTKCLRGHPLSGANLYIRKSDNARICRTCTAGRRHAAYMAKRQGATW